MDRRDVLEEILVRLPAKSLIRFRSVSKSWNSIITNRHFITKHFKRNLNQSESLISPNTHSGYLLYTTWDWNRSPSSKHLCTVACDSDGTLTQISRFEIPSIFEECSIVGFCNGLFCLASPSHDPNHILYLWNPSIRMKKLLATPSTDQGKKSVVGLAYNSQNNCFKILRLLTVHEGPAEALIYSLSTDSDSCRKVVISKESLWHTRNFGTIYAFEPPCIFFNGALHALAMTSRDCRFILSFDVNDDSYREIKLPINYSDVDSCQLALFNGSLAVFAFTAGGMVGLGLCDIWVMEKYGAPNPWTRKYTLQRYRGIYGRPDNGELLIEDGAWLSFSSRDTELILYDPESKKRNILAIKDADWMSFTADSMESSFYSMAVRGTSDWMVDV